MTRRERAVIYSSRCPVTHPPGKNAYAKYDTPPPPPSTTVVPFRECGSRREFHAVRGNNKRSPPPWKYGPPGILRGTTRWREDAGRRHHRCRGARDVRFNVRRLNPSIVTGGFPDKTVIYSNTRNIYIYIYGRGGGFNKRKTARTVINTNRTGRGDINK